MDRFSESKITVTSCSNDYIALKIAYNEFIEGQLYNVLSDTDVITWKLNNEDECTEIIIQLDIPTIDEETLFYVGVGVTKKGKETKKAVVTLNADELAVLNKLLLNDKESIYASIENVDELDTKTILEIYVEPSLYINNVLNDINGSMTEIFGNSEENK